MVSRPFPSHGSWKWALDFIVRERTRTDAVLRIIIVPIWNVAQGWSTHSDSWRTPGETRFGAPGRNFGSLEAGGVRPSLENNNAGLEPAVDSLGHNL